MSGPILVFDSGVGGLTVLTEIHRLLPQVPTVFAADTAAFPYGRLSAEGLNARVMHVMTRLIADVRPALAVIACNTASTLVLTSLRARFDIPFVGTVPAIKPAAAMTKSGLITVLATPATVQRDYTADLIKSFAGDKQVTLIGAPRLASLVEASLRGEAVADADIAAEIMPAFVERGGARTDVVVLACTHYPLLMAAFERLAPWPVAWLDPAPAIARRVKDVLPAGSAWGPPVRHQALVTSNGSIVTALTPAFAGFGLDPPQVVAIAFSGSSSPGRAAL
jgi:glutamate racemase